jgi:hypothetical protein
MQLLATFFEFEHKMMEKLHFLLEFGEQLAERRQPFGRRFSNFGALSHQFRAILDPQQHSNLL